MKKILFIFLTLFVFSGCIGLRIYKDYSIIEQNNFKHDKFKISIFMHGYDSLLIYGLIPYEYYLGLKLNPFRSNIKIKTDGFEGKYININSFSIKKNDKYINKNLHFYRTYFGIVTEEFYLFTKNKDIIEIICDLSIEIQDKIINKTVSAKFKPNKKFGIGAIME